MTETAVRRRHADRRAFTFYLDPGLVDRARQEVSEPDMVRSIEAALAAAIDYQMWIREVADVEVKTARNGRD